MYRCVTWIVVFGAFSILFDSTALGQSTDCPPPADIPRIQEKLKELGYYNGYVDGVWGQISKDALRAFKRDHGLADDRLWDVETNSGLLKAQANSKRETGLTTGNAPMVQEDLSVPVKRPQNSISDKAQGFWWLLFFSTIFVEPIRAARQLDRRLHTRNPSAKSFKWGYWNGHLLSATSGFLGVSFLLAVLGLLLVNGTFSLKGLLIVLALCPFFVLGVSIELRNRWAWIVWTIVSLNPILWVVNGIYIKNRWKEIADEQASSSADGAIQAEETEKVCPLCAERIKMDARLCRYCGTRFTEEEMLEAKDSVRRAREKHAREKEAVRTTQEIVETGERIALLQEEGKKYKGGEWRVVVGTTLLFISGGWFLMEYYDERSVILSGIVALWGGYVLIKGLFFCHRADKTKLSWDNLKKKEQQLRQRLEEFKSV